MVKIVLALALAAVAIAAPLQNRAACAELHMIVARGSTEAQGEGSVSAVTSLIKKAIPGATSEGIVYPATLTDYQSSESAGAAAMTAAIISYVKACPNSKIALLGYSQGAQVIGDSLGGGSFTASAPISTTLTKNVIAAIQFADPAHITGKSYDVGNSRKNGTFPRANTAALDKYSSILQSYCISGDEFCDSGNSVLIHLAEVSTNGMAASKFVIAKAKAAGL